jgi:hypothetical protein
VLIRLLLNGIKQYDGHWLPTSSMYGNQQTPMNSAMHDYEHANRLGFCTPACCRLSAVSGRPICKHSNISNFCQACYIEVVLGVGFQAAQNRPNASS